MKASKQRPPHPVPQPTYELRLTALELVHLRDLFSILLPPEGKQTVSQGLAQAEDRGIVESILWGKVAVACKQAKVPTDERAPDFVVAALIPPPSIGVYRIADQAQAPAQPDAAQVFEQYFHPGDNDDGGTPPPPPAPKKKPRAKKTVAKDGEA